MPKAAVSSSAAPAGFEVPQRLGIELYIYIHTHIYIYVFMYVCMYACMYKEYKDI